MCPGKIHDILKRENSTFGRFPECLFWKRGDFLETYEKEKNHCVSWSDPLRDCRMSGKKNDGGVYTERNAGVLSGCGGAASSTASSAASSSAAASSEASGEDADEADRKSVV